MNKTFLPVLSAFLFLNATAWAAEKGVVVDTNQTLTENIKDNASDDLQEFELPKPDKNWLKELIGTAQEKVGLKPSEIVAKTDSTLPQRANASVFNVAGVMLRMNYAQAENALTRRGYRQTMQKMDIPNFIRWRGEDLCRRQGVIGYERLENCVVKMAKKEGYQFIAESQFDKYDTQETIHIYLTSNFTGNKVYKITYQSEAANITGNSAKAIYLRNIKVYDFWKKINQKYGTPDNKDDIIWGLGGNQAYMKGETGRLMLEDPMLRELDFTRMSREDQRFINTDVFNF